MQHISKRQTQFSSQTADNGIRDDYNHKGNTHKEDNTQVKRLHKQPDGNEISNGPLTTWNSLSAAYFRILSSH